MWLTAPKTHSSFSPETYMRIRFIVLLLLIFGAAAAQASSRSADVTDSLSSILNRAEHNPDIYIGCEGIHAGADLIGFYQKRFFMPIWVDDEGLNERGKAFAEVLNQVESHGFNPDDYHRSCINEWIDHQKAVALEGPLVDADYPALIDILMTNAFMIFGSHLAAGRVDPERLYPHWFPEKRKADISDVLNRLSNGLTLEEALRQLAPPSAEYWRMVDEAGKLKKIIDDGGWPVLTTSKTLKKGNKGAYVSLLDERLRASGDLVVRKRMNKTVFDTNLEAAVKTFQIRHGLEADGIVGPETREALNVSAPERWRQVVLNLERWRWLPHRWGNRHIIVNVPAFRLEAYNSDQLQLAMKVIVGEAYKGTPVFSERISSIEINPYWNVPDSITLSELLPEIKKDPDYLAENHYELLSGWGKSGSVRDPALIEWENIGIENFPGRLRQVPGPWNSLGRIKFMFPNSFDVYLHDTPYRSLFRKSNRALSHGCIRVGKPVELALFILQDDIYWTRERILSLIESGQRHIIEVFDPCMVHVMYWTCWVGKEGKINFRNDIYNYDEILWNALKEVPEKEKRL